MPIQATAAARRALIAVLAAALMAVTSSPGGAQSTAPPPTAPFVRLPLPADDGSLTPYTFRLGYHLMTLVYDTLLWRDAEGVAQPWLATSVEPNADATEFTIRLAQGVRWHDGMPLTAADVAFTFAFLRDHPHPRFTPQLSAVERVEALDPSTVVATLRHPSAGFLDQPLADLPILPAHLWQGLRSGQVAPEGLAVGSGPYRLVEHEPSESYRFEANTDYFRGTPAVTTIEVPILPTAAETVRALERGEVDIVPGSLPKAVADRVRQLGIRVVEGPSYLGTVLLVNVRAPPFGRADVRRAVTKALDIHLIARVAGGAEAADHGYLHPASRWASREVLHVHDEAAARQVLGSAQLPAVRVLAPENDAAKVEASRQVALALQRAGMKAESTPTESEEFSRATGEDGSFPSFQLAIASSPPLVSYDPSLLRRLFGSDPRQAPLNVTGYASADFDERARRIDTTLEPEARRSAVEAALRILATDAPVVPLFFAPGTFAYRPAVYDGWVFVKGAGIVDKRSFVEPRPAPVSTRQLPEVTGDGGQAGRFPFGLVALGVLGVVVAVAVGTLARNRRG